MYVVLPMRTMRMRKWRKELEYPKPRGVVGFYSKNLCASLMVSPFEILDVSSIGACRPRIFELQ